MGRRFFFTRRTLFPPLDKRDTRDKAKDLRIASERHIGELGVRYLSTLNRVQDSRQQSQTTIASHHAPTEQSVPPRVRVPSSPYPKDKEKPPPTDATSSVSGGYPVGYLLSSDAYSL